MSFSHSIIGGYKATYKIMTQSKKKRRKGKNIVFKCFSDNKNKPNAKEKNESIILLPFTITFSSG